MKLLRSKPYNYVELDLHKSAHTSTTIRLSDGKVTDWVELSKLEDDPEYLPNGLVRVIMPEFLAAEKGWI